ncbi:helix-turn-helix domain-containing protein [Halobacteriovorax sp. DA5]|uniref:helix-turn-helix domain-containing protein n=1 Tax=Halobacteriovorax sp. DA5 TaxID=2067553 RepID=UPI000CD25171|nr:helix-turn-helix domain-containing protein [Halobacteriovorax sp. DA5]POB13190.1 hypothetical protein C0Z22_11795 [Halobacteriovorax sp. DA5]
MDKVFLERPSVNEVLRDKIRKYKKEHSRLSSNQIARRLGLPPSTFHRLEMGDVKNPGLDICVTVLNGLCSKKETAEFVREYFPEVHDSLYSHFMTSNQLDKYESNVEEYFRDQSTFKMMIGATTCAGISENEILQEYGRSGHTTFMKLAADGILKNENGRFYHGDKTKFLDGATGAKVISLIYEEMLNEIRVHSRAQKSKYDMCYESVDASKVKAELKELADEYFYNVKKIMFNPKNRGENIVVVSNLLREM